MRTRFAISLTLVITLLLAACTPASVQTATQQPGSPTQTVPATEQPTAIPLPSETVAPTEASNGMPEEFSLDYATVAQSLSMESVAAQPANPGDPYWVGTPRYRLLTLQGYPITVNKVTPQIFIYPVAEMASANQNMAAVSAELQTLLQTHQAGDQLPLLPLPLSEKQIIDARVQYLDFQNGSGVSFLTQTGNGIVPINNDELTFSFQGLTSDGQYYIAALLPVTNPELPTGRELGQQMATEIEKDPGYYMNYLSATITLLEQQPAGSFTPDLESLDDMISSLFVPPVASATPTPEVFIPAPLEGVLADKTREDLASRLGVDLPAINVVEITHQEWPDSCLGLAPEANQQCAEDATPGWRIVLNAAGHTNEYRANEDGSLVSYSGPVMVSGPEACMMAGTSLVYSPEDGYCFAYPLRFHRTDQRGPIAIYGPAYGSGPEPLYASLTVEISLLADSQNLDEVVTDFLAGLGDVPMPQTRLVIDVAGQPALMLEVVPGMLGSRDVFFIHNQQLFHLTFWPAPAVASDTAADVEDLYRTVLESWNFQN
jgi:hypothetical protein